MSSSKEKLFFIFKFNKMYNFIFLDFRRNKNVNTTTEHLSFDYIKTYLQIEIKMPSLKKNNKLVYICGIGPGLKVGMNRYIIFY